MKERTKLEKWIKENRKALYWPLIAISYHILSPLAMKFAFMYRFKILATLIAFPSIPAILFIDRSTQMLDEIFYGVNNNSLVYVVYFFVFIVAFYGLGLAFNKIKNKWLKVLFVLLVLMAWSLYLVYLVISTQKIQHF